MQLLTRRVGRWRLPNPSDDCRSEDNEGHLKRVGEDENPSLRRGEVAMEAGEDERPNAEGCY